jgi:CsoR family transcriptional regulator, copper-sensing transcriptional repressor
MTQALAVPPATRAGRAESRIDRSTSMHGYAPNKDDHQRRLRRIEGQIRGLQRMVDNDEYCIDILTQISAATRALQAVSVSLLDEHLRHCVSEAITEGGETAEAKIKEASDAIARLVRS